MVSHTRDQTQRPVPNRYVACFETLEVASLLLIGYKQVIEDRSTLETPKYDVGRGVLSILKMWSTMTLS
jgi:hypothetical protein